MEAKRISFIHVYYEGIWHRKVAWDVFQVRVRSPNAKHLSIFLMHVIYQLAALHRDQCTGFEKVASIGVERTLSIPDQVVTCEYLSPKPCPGSPHCKVPSPILLLFRPLAPTSILDLCWTAAMDLLGDMGRGLPLLPSILFMKGGEISSN